MTLCHFACTSGTHQPRQRIIIAVITVRLIHQEVAINTHIACTAHELGASRQAACLVCHDAVPNAALCRGCGTVLPVSSNISTHLSCTRCVAWSLRLSLSFEEQGFFYAIGPPSSRAASYAVMCPWQTPDMIHVCFCGRKHRDALAFVGWTAACRVKAGRRLLPHTCVPRAQVLPQT
jgi:hypothetical protein